MLRSTTLSLGTYHKKVIHATVNHQRPRWLAPRRPHRATAVANKMTSEEVKDTEDQRRGVDWYNRLRKRKAYRHWPFIRMDDDPIRRHKNADNTPSRAFSLNDTKCTAGIPEWDYYAETGRDYQTSIACPTHYMAKFIALFTAKVWKEAEIEASLKLLEKEFPTIGDLAASRKEAVHYNRKNTVIPPGLMTHAVLCASDIATYNARVNYRAKMQRGSILRTNEMEQYFALPYLLKPSTGTPVELVQPEGVWPEGDFLTLRAIKAYNHPIQPTPISKTRL